MTVETQHEEGQRLAPLLEMRHINVAFGGVHAVATRRSTSTRARSWAWSAATAPASRPSCARCPARIEPTRARS